MFCHGGPGDAGGHPTRPDRPFGLRGRRHASPDRRSVVCGDPGGDGAAAALNRALWGEPCLPGAVDPSGSLGVCRSVGLGRSRRLQRCHLGEWVRGEQRGVRLHPGHDADSVHDPGGRGGDPRVRGAVSTVHRRQQPPRGAPQLHRRPGPPRDAVQRDVPCGVHADGGRSLVRWRKWRVPRKLLGADQLCQRRGVAVKLRRRPLPRAHRASRGRGYADLLGRVWRCDRARDRVRILVQCRCRVLLEGDDSGVGRGVGQERGRRVRRVRGGDVRGLPRPRRPTGLAAPPGGSPGDVRRLPPRAQL
mmetsp:Transcript_10296/g.30977  ORF Transcript_10296/g.30977 Transcript_10296/m.30977 type:complete len:304 (-) Transcript_10296:1448-2359(-)